MDYICPECQNIYDTRAEADACATRDIDAQLDALLGPPEYDDSHDHTYSDPRWDSWSDDRGER